MVLEKCCSFELSADIFLCSSSFSHNFFPLSVPDDITALLLSTLFFFLSRTFTLAWAFASSCFPYRASACSSASLLFCMNETSVISSATFSFSATGLSFVDDFFDDLEELGLNLTLSYFWMIFLIYPASPLISTNYVPCAWRRKLWISNNILNISFSCCNSCLTAMPFWEEYIRLSISLDFLITLDINFDLSFCSKATLPSFPFSANLSCLFVFPSSDGMTPILYNSSWMAPTFSLILSWPSHKNIWIIHPWIWCLYMSIRTSQLISSIVFLFVISDPRVLHSHQRLWVSFHAPFNTIFPSLFDFPSADILYPPVHLSLYTTNVTAYLSGFILDESACLCCIFNIEKLIQ